MDTRTPDAVLRLHVPAPRAAALLPGLEAAASGLAAFVREKTAPVLRLDSLRCLLVSLHGSGEHVRIPFVAPLLRTDAFNIEPPATPPQALPGPDWLVLGAAVDDLARQVVQGLRARRQAGLEPELRIAPYAALAGRLPAEPAPGDVPFTFRKSAKNFNQPTWAKSMRKLLELPEERWGEVGIANTDDQIHVFDDALARLLPRPPRLVVDLGCGLGQNARSLALRFPEARVVGVDASAEAVAVASKAFPLPNLRFAAVDFSKPLGFQPGGVDLLVSTNALPYAQDQLGAARELFGLLSPEGLLLNHCRAEESHLFWDFPRSLALPTNTQIFVADWVRAAKESGRGTELSSVALGMTPVFYQANALAEFSRAMTAWAEPQRRRGPLPYVPWCSHVLLAHSALAAPLGDGNGAGAPLGDGHLERLDLVLASVAAAPPDIQDAAICAWIHNARAMALTPEALDCLGLLLPRSAPALRAVLGPGLGLPEKTAG